jgi:hypothetical protein
MYFSLLQIVMLWTTYILINWDYDLLNSKMEYYSSYENSSHMVVASLNVSESDQEFMIDDSN